MAWRDVDVALERLEGFIRSYDRAAATEWCSGLRARIADTIDPYPADAAKKALSLLRTNRWMDLLETMAEAFLRVGINDPKIRRLHAQALIDGGRPVVAIDVLSALVADLPDGHAEVAEARGLLGRCFKQLYIESGHPGFERNRKWLRDAVDAYLTVYRTAPEQHIWHGVNVAALLSRAARDGVDVAGAPTPQEVAAEVLGVVEGLVDAGKAEAWDLASAMEACIALGDDTAALDWLGRYVQLNAGSFEYAGTLRQLEEVWQFGPEGERGAMLEILRSAVLASEGGTVEIAPSTAQTAEAALDSVPTERLEKVLGFDGVKSLNWYRMGLARSEAVAKICDATGTGRGTGFLLAGSELSSKLPPNEMFVVTNAHVVSDSDPRAALHPDDATIGFEALGLAPDYEVAEQVFTSPHDKLDVTILKLDRPAPEVTRIPVYGRLPVSDGHQRVYVIGHPMAGELSFSLQDNLLLDVASPKLHYRAPTEPGSSGSPVFNAQWKLVALHHASVSTRLNPAAAGDDEAEPYAANEGLWIEAIKQALDAHLSQAEH